jgi:DNA-directed RNA polymerase subunit RPC12/RpoP
MSDPTLHFAVPAVNLLHLRALAKCKAAIAVFLALTFAFGGTDVRAQDPDALLKKSPLPNHKATYAQEYFHSFKGDQEIGPEFHWHGLDPHSVAVFEPPGLRITLPRGFLGKRMGTGIGIDTLVKGDFEITMRYEMIQEPEPDGAGEGNCLFLWVDLNKPEMNRGFISRGVGPEKQFLTWYHLSQGENEKPIDVLRTFPAKGAVGRLRLVRTGSVLFHYVAEGNRAEFTLLEQHPFGAEDLQSIRWGGQTNGPNAALEGRFFDVRIRADSLPDLSTNPGAEPVPTAVPFVPKGAHAGWLAAGVGVGLAFLLASALGLGLILRWRHRGLAPSAVPDAEIPSAAMPNSISFSCPECGMRVKARSASTGRKVKCPKCSQQVQVPEADADVGE